MRKIVLVCGIICLFIFSFVFVGCSDNKDDPQTDDNSVIGYWAITHIQTIEQIGGVRTIIEKDVPPHGIEGYAGEINYRYDVLIFDAEFVTVRGDMPSRPKSKDYDLETMDGNVSYSQDLDNWEKSIGDGADEIGCPVGRYVLNGDELIIGSLNMGTIGFVSNSEFRLDYTKPMANTGDFRCLIYTYSRITSLTL